MNRKDTERMLDDGKRHESMRMQSRGRLGIGWQLLIIAAVLWVLSQLGGCAASRLDKLATPQDRAACEKDVAPYKAAAWLIAYRDCLKAKGYK